MSGPCCKNLQLYWIKWSKCFFLFCLNASAKLSLISLTSKQAGLGPQEAAKDKLTFEKKAEKPVI